MNHLELITTLKNLLVTDKRQFEFTACMVLSGDKNKTLRQNIAKELTGELLPVYKCGMNYIISLIKSN